MVEVGDPNQLLPTSFFDRINEVDEEEMTGTEQSEEHSRCNAPNI